jgi:hypothetical protein
VLEKIPEESPPVEGYLFFWEGVLFRKELNVLTYFKRVL